MERKHSVLGRPITLIIIGVLTFFVLWNLVSFISFAGIQSNLLRASKETSKLQTQTNDVELLHQKIDAIGELIGGEKYQQMLRDAAKDSRKSVDDGKDVTDQQEEEVIVLTSKESRRQRYNYEPPIGVAKKSVDCGVSPAFDNYFQLRGTERSVNDEDKDIYNKIFKGSDSPGTYIELGAFDGVKESNTRFFDECLGWTGLLIEGNPKKYSQLIANRPNAHKMQFAPSCSQIDENKGKTIGFYSTIFTNAALVGVKSDYEGKENLVVEVPCGTLTNAILDVFPDGNVNFFSLDVEGSEPNVLKTLDFSKVKIDVLIAEGWNNNCPRNGECQSRNETRAIMAAAGYKIYPYDFIHKSDLYIHSDSKFHVQDDS